MMNRKYGYSSKAKQFQNCTIGYTDTDIHGLSIGIGTDTDTTPRNVSAIPIVSVSVSGIGIDR